jgi:hypothetical protein
VKATSQAWLDVKKAANRGGPSFEKAVAQILFEPTPLVRLCGSDTRQPAGRPTSGTTLPIVLKKSFWDDDQNFPGPVMRFARGDMTNHIVSRKNDHGPS